MPRSFMSSRLIGWWQEVGLSYSGSVRGDGYEYAAEAAALAVLREHAPVAFSGGPNGTLSLAELRALIEAETERAVRAQRATADARQAEVRRLGWLHVETALAQPDAQQPVETGRWSGFSRGEARAWCLTLFLLEPHGFVHPGSEVRHRAMRELVDGGLPEVFGYAERAHELALSGLHVRQYWQHREALAARVFEHPQLLGS